MKYLNVIFIILIATVVLLLPALYNGYPYIYSDTGTYIYSGFEGKVPIDRPLTYGLFVRHSSLASSLWFTVFAQALLASSLIWLMIDAIFKSVRCKTRVYIISIVMLSLFSSLTWFTTFIMADHFSALAYLLLFLLMYIPVRNKIIFLASSLTYLFFTSMHLTNAPGHLFILIVLVICKLLIPAFKHFFSWNQIRIGYFVVLLNFVFTPTIHWLFSGEFVTTKAGHLFITARNVENGSLKAYLDDNCENKAYRLCNYKDSLPQAGSDFLWKSESPLYRLGGWEKNAEEYKAINTNILLTPKYLQLFFSYYCQTILYQLILHKVGCEFIPFGKETPPGWEIANHFKEEENAFLAARQCQGKLDAPFNILNMVYLIFGILSFIIIIYLLITGKSRPLSSAFAFCTLLYYFGNMLVVSIASAGSRYNTRIEWLLLFSAILIITETASYRNKTAKAG
ncbi:MAG: hypothetical protein H7296_02260 [Bacteroidia bacterium]|nr:hypothetical protein [Bacteroidia bacterium]